MDYIELKRPQYNLRNGQFLKGHIPHNKGKKWEEYMDMRKARRIIRIAKMNLRHGNPNIGGWNKRQVVMVTPKGNWVVFESATEAASKMGLERRNISHCCQGKRQRCGGRWWFFFDDDRWITQLSKIQKELENSQAV